ncbi:hypothetical protein [Desulfobacula toluolica]|uniref:Uncharacterized protein n=1 Tax=Desulfobacula toluolica (strain DSM 7467 / Tol2) TaxID=651182 RepID=K0NGA5_DESTT|nr:hypothetical protein [Desulfobacula toluolica]CCK78838.1 uncharacterized protein TOL2_C06690 [Desulfobacula toluolica Tol2]
MSIIQGRSLSAEPSRRQNSLYDQQFSTYARKQSFSASESLDAGLTIKTREGDLVTLTSNSYSGLDASMYNSKGVMKTDSGTAMITQNQREITLTSGESFSFFVTGDLSEEELEDINTIVKDMDEIISKMAHGDMDDAVAKAVSMGDYDTVSMYSADITYKKSYEMRSETRTETVNTIPGNGNFQKEEMPVPSLKEFMPENQGAENRENNFFKNIDKFVEKMMDKLEAHEKKQVVKAQKAIDQLFRHHLKDVKINHSEDPSRYTAIETAGKQINTMLDQMSGILFKEQVSALF